jgi:hypothetical protein
LLRAVYKRRLFRFFRDDCGFDFSLQGAGRAGTLPVKYYRVILLSGYT